MRNFLDPYQANNAHQRMRHSISTLLLLARACVGVASLPRILVYSKTAGYRHDSIPVAIDAISSMSTGLFLPTFSEDENLFTPALLQPFTAIAFLSNSDEVLTTAGQAALEGYLAAGGSLLGFHAATACLFNNTAFGAAFGSWFDYHPLLQSATFVKLVGHPTIDMLPARYTYVEEVYHFRSDPRATNVTVLLSVDSASYDDPQNGTRPYYEGPGPLPIAWYRDSPLDLSNGTSSNGPFMTGRMWMTSLGHTNEAWRSSLHLAHIKAGIEWVLESAIISNSSASTSSLTSSTSRPTPTSVALPTTLSLIPSSTRLSPPASSVTSSSAGKPIIFSHLGIFISFGFMLARTLSLVL